MGTISSDAVESPEHEPPNADRIALAAASEGIDA